MADIFISYSSKDREKADQLSELLASAGLSVWIDKKSLEISTSWSGEIADAIEQCTAFIILLSPNSAVSVNVAKEVSLASHYKKKILPLDLEPVELSRDLAYHLAGLHRAPMTNIDAIIRAISTFGLEATQAPTIKLIKETDSRKSLMILPFEDLSPTGDNGWFADGIVSELINALSNVKSLRLANNQATKEFKNYHGQLATYAQTMSIRYFVQGDVRKFGDTIKISSRLLDIETSDYLWQDSLKGKLEDIFDIQESVAQNVVEGLKLHLASEEKHKLGEHGTKNAQAYESYLRAGEYFDRFTKEALLIAIDLFNDAINLDSQYANAYSFKATALLVLYNRYDRTTSLLDEAESLAKKALSLQPNLVLAYSPLSIVYMYRNMLTEAEEAAKEYVRQAPLYWHSHFALGYFYDNTAQYAKAIAPFEESLRLQPDSLSTLWNLVVDCDSAQEQTKCVYWATAALPYFERYLKLHPDDQNRRVQHAALLQLSGNIKAAHSAAVKLKHLQDAHLLFTVATLLGRLGDIQEGLATVQKAIEAGFKNTALLRKILTEKETNLISLKETQEYEMVDQMVEKIEVEADANG